MEGVSRRFVKVTEEVKDDMRNSVDCFEVNVLINIREIGGEDNFKVGRRKMRLILNLKLCFYDIWMWLIGNIKSNVF